VIPWQEISVLRLRPNEWRRYLRPSQVGLCFNVEILNPGRLGASAGDPGITEEIKMDKRSVGASFEVVSWEQYNPLTDRFMLYDLVRVFVAFLAIMQASLLVMAFFIGEDLVILPLRIYLILLLIFYSLYIFVALAIFRNKFWASFAIAPEGAMYQMGLGERRINRLVLAMSLLFRRTGPTGASLLALSQESGIVEWKDVYNVKIYPKERLWP
jgi:hypothetical protein